VTRLRTRDLACGYGSSALVERCDLSLDPGAATAIVGPNGAGKSTILRTLAGTVKPIAGRIEIDGAELTEIDTNLRARSIAMLMQIQPLDPALTVEELVELGRTPYVGAWGHLRREDVEAADEAISLCRLEELRRRPLGRVSGGERQRARLAMVLAQQSKLVLLDEPTNHLDVSHRYMLYRILERIRGERGVTVVVVAHSLEDAARFGESILYLDDRRLRSFGADEIDELRQAIEDAAGVPGEWVY
jgi:iron complex transport system ATP-binding protein